MGAGTASAAPDEGKDRAAAAAQRFQSLARAKSVEQRADVLHAAGRYAEALPLRREVLALREQALGPEHSYVATSLNNLALLHDALGEAQVAHELLKRALAIQEKQEQPASSVTGVVLASLAGVVQELGDLRTAHALFERCLALRLALGGPEHLDVARCRQGLSSVLKAEGSLDAARALLEQARATFERVLGPENDETAGCLANLGDLLRELGDPRAGRPLLERALAVRERVLGPEHPTTSLTRNNLGLLLGTVGALKEARTQLERARAGFERSLGPRHPHTASVGAALAQVLQEQGELEGAGELFERVLALREELLGPDHRSTTLSLCDLALALRDQGDLARARSLVERALAARERTLGPEHPLTAAALGNLASILDDLGDAQAARSLRARALWIYERSFGPAHPDTALARNSLAVLLSESGDPAAARTLFERVLTDLRSALGNEHQDTATAANNLGTVLRELKELPAARTLLEESIAVRERLLGPDHPALISCLGNLGLLLEEQGDSAGALALFERALALADSGLGGDHPVTILALNNLAGQRFLHGETALGRGLAARMLDALESHVQKSLLATQGPERLQLVASVRAYLDRWLRMAGRLGETGYAEVLRFKGLVRRLEAAERRLARAGVPGAQQKVEALRSAQRRLSALAGAPPRGADAERRRAWREGYAALSAERERLARSLATDLARIAPASVRRRVGPDELRSHLGPTEALIDVLLVDGRYFAWVIVRDHEPARMDLGAAVAIEDAARDFVERTSAPATTLADAAWRAAGERLARLVIAPLRPALPAALQALYLCPDAALAAVPYAALPGHAATAFLGDEVDIVHLAQAEDLLPSAGTPTRGSGALLVGDVDFDRASPTEALPAPAPTGRTGGSGVRAPAGRRFPPLPATADEVSALRVRFGVAALALVGGEATEAGLRASAPGRRYLHLATHGFVRTDIPSALARRPDPASWLSGSEERHLLGLDPMLLAGLALAGANPRQGGGDDDGVLTALEASALNLDACELVVLSACETALGTAASGEGVLGLVQGFQLAGARHVVASLWRVDDHATRLLMEAFYGALASDTTPLSPARALGVARQALRAPRADGLDLSAPRLWAPFVAYQGR